MHDLDQLLDSLVDDVAASTRPPGASTAIKRAQRRRATFAVAAGGAVAFVAAGGFLGTGALGSGDQASVTGDPATASPSTVQESAEPTPRPDEAALETILNQWTGWATNPPPADGGDDYAFNGPCAGSDWMKGAASGGDGGVAGVPYVAAGHAGFPTNAQTSAAAAKLVENLTSCETTIWRTQTIADTGAVLAISTDGVAWVQQGYREVHVLQVRRTGGPPPVSVQVDVAEWLTAYITRTNTD